MKRLLAVLLLWLCLFCTARGEEYKYILHPDNTATITGYTGTSERLNIPREVEGHTVTSVGDRAFLACFSARAVFIPDTVISIGELAFCFCDWVDAFNLPDSVVRIGDYAFASCGFTSFEIPGSVLSVGINPFENCGALKYITVPYDHPALQVKDGVLFSKEDQRLICYPAGFTNKQYVIPEGTKIIGDYAFSSCDSLSTLTIPDSVTFVGNNPFTNCSNLTDVRMSSSHPTLEMRNDALIFKPDQRLIFCAQATAPQYSVPDGIRMIGDAAFASCRNLTAVTIPESVVSIGNKAFQGCQSLTTVTLPQSVVSIGDKAFFNCFALSSVYIPASVTNIGEDVFFGCECTVLLDPGSYAETYCQEKGLPYAYR